MNKLIKNDEQHYYRLTHISVLNILKLLNTNVGPVY